MNLNTKNTMIIFTDGSALSNPGPVGAGVVIKNIQTTKDQKAHQ